MEESVLSLLTGEGFVSGEKMSRQLGITRAAVWKKIRQLQAEGWPVESAGRRGYRLGPCDRLEPVLWRRDLTTRALGRGTVCCLDRTDSTNSQLKRMALEGAPHGSLCLCEEQTAGRGRLGRSWVSQPGAGLWLSVLVRPRLSPSQAPLLTLCTALAMAEAVRTVTGLRPGIKWPNDLVLEGRKICGILLEISAEPDQIEYVVIGTGLNVKKNAVPPELAAQAAALEDFCTPPLRHRLLTAYLAALETRLDALSERGWEAVAPDYQAACVTLGSTVQVSGAVSCTGVAERVDEQGALWVRDGGGVLHRVLSGDVSVRGVMGYV